MIALEAFDRIELLPPNRNKVSEPVGLLRAFCKAYAEDAIYEVPELSLKWIAMKDPEGYRKYLAADTECDAAREKWNEACEDLKKLGFLDRRAKKAAQQRIDACRAEYDARSAELSALCSAFKFD